MKRRSKESEVPTSDFFYLNDLRKDAGVVDRAALEMR